MNTSKVKDFEVVWDDESTIKDISFVDEPALREYWMAFSSIKENLSNIKFQTADKEKKIITGAAMIPDKRLLRKDQDTGEYFNVYFTAETIEQIVLHFFKNNDVNQSSINHQFSIDGIIMRESFLVSEDKPYQDYPNGTWIVSYKVEDDNLWNEYIKTGELKGFSVEVDALIKGKFSLEQMMYRLTKSPDKAEKFIDNLTENKEMLMFCIENYYGAFTAIIKSLHQ